MDPFLSILKKYWGYDNFRGIQREIIESIASGKDTLGLMPTGGGKSITFQVPALATSGICIVITPLIALMKDQVTRLRSLGIKAAYVHVDMKREDIIVTLENCIFGDYKFLYVSPERLTSEFFITKLRHMKVSFITIDEAHCISQWGYDFRPSYLKIKDIRKVLPDAAVLALTGSATPSVIDDIQEQLGFREKRVFRMSFARPNISYEVRTVHACMPGLRGLLLGVEGSCIVYTTRRQQCEQIAKELDEMGFSVTFYHAGLPDKEKDLRQKDWQEDKTRIMVATSAFGMGIDKPNVRLVAHVSPPDSLEEYYQEAGRAGRDGKPSYAVMLREGKEVKTLHQQLANTFPSIETIRDYYDKVCYYLQMAMGDGEGVSKEFNLYEFCVNFGCSSPIVKSSLHLLAKAGYIEFSEEKEAVSRLLITSTRRDLYKLIPREYESLFTYIMRRYTGVFGDYVFIDEKTISYATGFSQDEIYQHLMNLSRLHIVSYIPRRHNPYIKFLQRRVEGSRIVLPPSIYEQQKESMRKRIESVIAYIKNEEICRSTFLLEYFGEKVTEDCGHCDICQSKHPEAFSEEIYHEISEDVIQQISNNDVFAPDIDLYKYNREHVRQTLQRMMVEERIRWTDDGRLVATDK